MKSFAALALVGAVVAMPQPQGVTSAIAPQESIPAGCSTNYDGEFQISVVNVTTSSKRSLNARQSKPLTITLKDGTLTDDQGRNGYIASNNQFQFDAPVQAGAIYTSGFSVCSNNTLALGDSAIFYQCLSGTFYNLYDESTGEQCNQIYIDIIGGAAATSGVASQIPDGQVTGSAVSQISDGQVQATTGIPAPVTQIADGQVQATTGAVVTQISDGQIQAATTPAPVTQISDGQIQAPASSVPVVSQISDGQIQAPTNGTNPTFAAATPTVSVFTGAANNVKAGFFGLAAGAVAVAML